MSSTLTNYFKFASTCVGGMLNTSLSLYALPYLFRGNSNKADELLEGTFIKFVLPIAQLAAPLITDLCKQAARDLSGTIYEKGAKAAADVASRACYCTMGLLGVSAIKDLLLETKPLHLVALEKTVSIAARMSSCILNIFTISSVNAHQ